MSGVTVKARSANQDQVSTWINLHQVVRIIQARLEERLQTETNLSWPEFEVLMRLQVATGHPLQMGEIAAQLVGSASGTTRIADRLETLFEARLDDPHDLVQVDPGRDLVLVCRSVLDGHAAHAKWNTSSVQACSL